MREKLESLESLESFEDLKVDTFEDIRNLKHKDRQIHVQQRC